MPSPASGLVPNFNAWLQTAWGAGAEFWSAGPQGFFGNATNLVFGQNPPYYLDTFLAYYPKFFGAPTVYSGVVTLQGSNQATFGSAASLLFGQFCVCGDFPPNTVITKINGNVVTFNNNALTTDSTATVQVYQAPVVPITVIQLYLNLANASLVQCRWQEEWLVAMGWFTAHYLTLYARSDAQEVLTIVQSAIHGETPTGTIPGTAFALSVAPVNGVLQGLYKNGVFQTPGVDYTLLGTAITMTSSVDAGDALYATWPINTTTTAPVVYTAAQVAAQGIANGIEVSKSVGDVSASYSVLNSLEQFGQWNLTLYGQQLATMAKVIGSGPMVIWAFLLACLLPHVSWLLALGGAHVCV